MTEELQSKLEQDHKEIDEIIEKHLRAMVSELNWKYLMSIDGFGDTFVNVYKPKLAEALHPIAEIYYNCKKEG